MADIRISDLNLLSTPEDSDYLLIVQSSGPLTKRIYVSDLFSYDGAFDSAELIDLLSSKGVNSIIPLADSAYDLGSASRKWRDLYLSGESLYLGGRKFTSGTIIKEVDNVAFMVADPSLTVGQKVRTKGYWTVGDGGATDYEIVAAGTGTSDNGSFIDLTGSSLQAKALFTDNQVTAHQFGAHGESLTRTQVTTRLQAMFNYAKDTEIVCKAWGSFNVNDRLHTNSNLEMTEAYLYYESDYTSYGLIVTPSVQDSANGPTYFDITNDTVVTPIPGKWNTNDILRRKRLLLPRVIRKHTGYESDVGGWKIPGQPGNNNTVVRDGSGGITLINLVDTYVDVPLVSGFDKGLFCWGRDSSGFAYNSIELGLLFDNIKGLTLFAGNEGWCNQNVFMNGHIAVSSGNLDSAGANYRRDGIDLITMTGTGYYGYPNNNTFIGTSLEGIVHEFIVNCIGSNNQWVNCRFEGGSSTGRPRMLFNGLGGFHAQYNQIIYGYGSNVFDMIETNTARLNTVFSSSGNSTSSSSSPGTNAGKGGTYAANNTYSSSGLVYAVYPPTLTISEFDGTNYTVGITSNGIGFKSETDDYNTLSIEKLVGGGEINAGDGTALPTRRIFFGANTFVDDTLTLYQHAWNNNLLQLGAYRLWVDGTGKLRIKSSNPTSDTDGTVVGTQT